MTSHPKLGPFDLFRAGADADPDLDDRVGADEGIEILGPHLRVSGTVNLGRFRRLSDLVNHSQGYLRLREARLLQRNGDPTSLTMTELLVNRDEITFVGQRQGAPRPVPGAETVRPHDFGQPAIPKVYRRFVLFTPGHIITGDAFVFQDLGVASFVESPDPRFVAMIKVETRSLADRRVISHFDLLLINKTQVTAAASSGMAIDALD